MAEFVMSNKTTGVDMGLRAARGFFAGTLNDVMVPGQNSAAHTGGVGYPTIAFTHLGVNFTTASHGAVVIPVPSDLLTAPAGSPSVRALTTFPYPRSIGAGSL